MCKSVLSELTGSTSCRYHMAQERKGRALNMYPPGRIIFLRPIKVVKRKRDEQSGEISKKLVKRWDAVWVSPREVVGEGILVSKRVRPGTCCVVACSLSCDSSNSGMHHHAFSMHC